MEMGNGRKKMLEDTELPCEETPKFDDYYTCMWCGAGPTQTCQWHKRRSTYEEAYERYTRTFAHFVRRGSTIGFYKPMAVCNHKELDIIFSEATTWQEVMISMRLKVGTAGPSFRGR